MFVFSPFNYFITKIATPFYHKNNTRILSLANHHFPAHIPLLGLSKTCGFLPCFFCLPSYWYLLIFSIIFLFHMVHYYFFWSSSTPDYFQNYLQNTHNNNYRSFISLHDHIKTASHLLVSLSLTSLLDYIFILFWSTHVILYIQKS